MNRALLLVIFFSYTAGSWATNALRELEYAEEIESSISVGKMTWLQAKNQRFLALYTETEEKNNLGTAILLHSMDGHPNQERIIKPLRTYLPKHQWATLSLQMPVLGVGVKEQAYYVLFDDAKVRIQAAIDYLVAAKVKNIVLIGYRLGGMMAIYYVRESSDSDKVKAVVTLSISAPLTEQKQVQIIESITKIDKPFFDIFAEFDSPDVVKSARKRRVAGKMNPDYRQFEIKGHLFKHDDELVVKRIYSWINRTFRGG